MREKKLKVLIIAVLIIAVGSVWISQNADPYKNVLQEQGYMHLERDPAAETGDITRVYRDGETWVQIISEAGYQSAIIMAVEITNNQVARVIILSQEETPDYGGYIAEEWFLGRLQLPIDPLPKLVKMAKKNSNDVVAVTGATISSQSVVDGVNKCIENYGGTNGGN